MTQPKGDCKPLAWLDELGRRLKDPKFREQLRGHSPTAPDGDSDRVAEIRQRLEAATPGTLIRWESSRYGALYGYIGSLRTSVFSISRSTTRDDPLPSKLRSELPGFTAERSSATEDESKARAEAVLIAFFRRALSGTTEGPS